MTSILTWLLSMDWRRILTWWGPGAVVWGRSIVAYCCWPAAVLPSVLVASTAFAVSVMAVTAAENDSAINRHCSSLDRLLERDLRSPGEPSSAALVFAAVVIAVSLSPIATFFASAATTTRSFLTLFNAVSA